MQVEKISIVIPCFNDYEFIEKSVQSALGQTYRNIEVIVVDDGSNEKTKNVLKKIEPTISFLITQDNKGTSGARNVGIAKATGEYILVLDSDDFFEPSFCEKAINEFKRNSEIKIVSCYAKWFRSEKNFQTFKPSGGKLEDFLIKNCSLGTMFRKIDWVKAEGYDENMQKGYEDWEFYIRILALGGEAKVIPEVLFNYRYQKNSRNKKANLAKYELLEYIFKKHSDLYKDHFEFFIHHWLQSVKKSEAFKQQVMDSLDYKIGNKILKPLRLMGFFRKNNL